MYRYASLHLIYELTTCNEPLGLAAYRRPLPRPLPRPRPLPIPPGPPALADAAVLGVLGVSSTSSASRLRLSGNIQDRTVLPRTERVLYETGFFPRTVTLALRRWAFMVASTPTTVPWITVPFLSSMVTVSRFNFCRNLTNFMAACAFLC